MKLQDLMQAIEPTVHVLITDLNGRELSNLTAAARVVRYDSESKWLKRYDVMRVDVRFMGGQEYIEIAVKANAD